MTQVASGIRKIVAWKKQTALDSPASGSGGKQARRTSSTFPADFTTYGSNEIVTHKQSMGAIHGFQTVPGRLNGELSPASFADLIASLCEKDFATGVNSTALTLTYGGSTGAWTAARATGSFLTDGFKVGDVIRASGGSVTANNSRNFLITAVVALTITFRAIDNATVTSGSSTTTTLTVTGKKTNVPTTSHVIDYYTFEEWYSGITKSETFPNCRVGAMRLNAPASGKATVEFDIVGLSRTKGTSQVLTSPSLTTTTSVDAMNSTMLINGAVQTLVTSLTLNLTNSAENAGAVLGSNVGQDVLSGIIQVSGTITAQFDSTTLLDLKDNKTAVAMTVYLPSDSSAAAEFVAITLPRIKIFTDTADDRPTAIVRTYNFVAEYNAAGGTGISSEQTIITVQDSAA